MPKAEKSNKTLLQNATNKLLGKAKAEPPTSSNVGKHQQSGNEAELRQKAKKSSELQSQRDKLKYCRRRLSSTSTLQNNMPPELRSRSSSPEASSVKATTEAAELRKQFEEIKKQLEEAENRSKEPQEPISRQLFGKEYKEDDMVLLKNNIYCQKRIYEMAMGCSFKSTHIARRLLEGVFKRDALVKCTLTGQSPKSQGKEKQMEKYDCLDRHAKMAIIEFALDVGKSRGWKPETITHLNRSLSQKIGEVKRQYKRQI